MKTVLDVGNCNPDHAAIRSMLSARYDVQVLRADALSDTLQILKKGGVDLVLINRKLDIDYSDGVEILKAIKADPDLSNIPVMIITNYPEHQEAAVALGAEYGFGKLQYQEMDTQERLSRFLDRK
ncbi:response regulator PleD [Pirellula sp. SH-Sr6A]|uniref:response regulator n=1 Tax=Pirellula sp. SH-Sr6A TaxID=1632865 RepID=UPI00078E0D0E|nr:response regulator [Pirellula sp. SH-Sr6A]AMV35515.1 response regulator PleD [Pirellula sp. SH-Sr6A]